MLSTLLNGNDGPGTSLVLSQRSDHLGESIGHRSVIVVVLKVVARRDETLTNRIRDARQSILAARRQECSRIQVVARVVGEFGEKHELRARVSLAEGMHNVERYPAQCQVVDELAQRQSA